MTVAAKFLLIFIFRGANMKKTKKFFSWLTAAAVICNAFTPSFAAAKRDVNDPVLREIINELSKKMPKFIDKYGETVFVEDEPITRGALISAIYEYDRRTKPSAAASGGTLQVQRQEFDSLKAKVASLEKGKSQASSAKTPSSGKVDMIALIAELQPNMPALLDDSLNSSQVFKSLRQQVSDASGKQAYASVKEVKEINAKIEHLAKRVASAEDGISGEAKSSSKKAASYASVSKDISEMNSKLEKLSKRVDFAESKISAASPNSKMQSFASQKEINELKNTLNQIQQSYVKLSKRVDALNDAPFVVSASGKEVSDNDMSYIHRQLSDIKKTVSLVPTSAEMKNEINRNKNQTQADIERIEKRLNSISASSRASSSSGGSSGGGSGAAIATISLGITMLAALFAAR